MILYFKRLFKTLTGKQANFLLVIGKFKDFLIHKQDFLQQLEFCVQNRLIIKIIMEIFRGI